MRCLMDVTVVMKDDRAHRWMPGPKAILLHQRRRSGGQGRCGRDTSHPTLFQLVSIS
jgi:hypothetical protein